jgi:uncharacterized protein YaaW (UPF0174 family)
MDTIDIKGDISLLNLLSNVPAGELGLLVDHVTDGGQGRLALSAAIKDLLLEAKQRQLYTQLTLKILIRELQQFGGHSVANLVRQSGVSYAEIVLDVLKHYNVSGYTAMPFEQQELAAVAARLAQLWPELDEAAKREYLTELSLVSGAGSDLSQLQSAILAGGRTSAVIARRLAQRSYTPNQVISIAKNSLLGFTVGGPTGAAITAATGAAYRVTVPCVLCIAGLRQQQAIAQQPDCPRCGTKAGKQARFCADCGCDLRSQAAPMTEAQLPAASIVASHDGASLIIAGEDRSPVLSISALGALDASQPMQSVDLRISGVDRLAPLLQLLPSAMVGSEVATNRYLKAVANGPLAPAADGNGLRGFVRGPDGKFTEHARFFEDDRLKNLVSGAAIFQIASVVVAQKHLADISRKLGEIQEGVARIEAFQRNERKSGINGTLQYLQQVAPVILAGALSSSVRDELEASERALSAIQDHILTDLNTAIAEVETLKDPGTFSSRDMTKALKNRQRDFEELAQQWNLCLAARFVACRLVCCYPEEQMLVERRQQTLNRLTQVLPGSDGLLRQFSAKVSKRSAQLRALTDTQVEIQANQENLRLWDIDRLPAIESQGHATLGQLGRMLQESAQPVAMVLEVRDGKIVRALAA